MDRGGEGGREVVREGMGGRWLLGGPPLAGRSYSMCYFLCGD